jgi:hypothetical protein
MLPKKQQRSYGNPAKQKKKTTKLCNLLNLSDTVNFFIFVEKQHVFCKSKEAL